MSRLGMTLMLTFLTVSMGAARAAEIKVLAAGAVRSTLAALAPGFEQKSGDHLVFTYGTAGGLRDQLAAGAAADIIIVTPATLAPLAAKGLLQAGSRADLGSVGSAVAVKAGAPTPDVATPDGLKAALLAAHGVAYVDPAAGGTSGIHFVAVLKQLGIADAVTAKARLARDGGGAAELVAADKADLVVTQKSEILRVPGLTILGPLPASLQNSTTYTGAVTSRAAAADAAAAFLRYLTSAEGRARFEAAGFDAPGK